MAQRSQKNGRCFVHRVKRLRRCSASKSQNQFPRAAILRPRSFEPPQNLADQISSHLRPGLTIDKVLFNSSLLS